MAVKIASQESYTDSHDLGVAHPSTTTYSSAADMSFLTPSAPKYKLTSAYFYLMKYLSPTGTLVAELYNVVNHKPQTVWGIAESNTYPAANLSPYPSGQWVEFTFPAAQQYVMNPNTWYGIAVLHKTKSGTGFPMFWWAAVGNPGVQYVYYKGAWLINSNSDTTFQVWGEPMPAAAHSVVPLMKAMDLLLLHAQPWNRRFPKPLVPLRI